MTVFLKYYGMPIFLDSGKRTIELPEASTVVQLIGMLCKAKDELETLETSMFLVNRTRAGLDTVLKAGDELMILNVLGGG